MGAIGRRRQNGTSRRGRKAAASPIQWSAQESKGSQGWERINFAPLLPVWALLRAGSGLLGCWAAGRAVWGKEAVWISRRADLVPHPLAHPLDRPARDGPSLLQRGTHQNRP